MAWDWASRPRERGYQGTHTLQGSPIWNPAASTKIVGEAASGTLAAVSSPSTWPWRTAQDILAKNMANNTIMIISASMEQMQLQLLMLLATAGNSYLAINAAALDQGDR